MLDREILKKSVDLENLCLSGSENKEVMDMLYKYKDVFCFRDEIGTCLNIEVEIYLRDKSLYFSRPYNVQEEDKAVLEKEM